MRGPSQPLSPMPVDACLPELLETLGRSASAILTAPTGAGKTTRVPPAISRSQLAEGQRVVVLEPRRIAARAAARRIAEEQGWTVGREVGWRMRLDRRESSSTRLLFATEGVLVRMLQEDPFLEGTALIIFDEIHERSLAADLALAMSRRVQTDAREDLRILAMSATPDTDRLARFLGDDGRVAPVISSQGRLHPVEVFHLEGPETRRIAPSVAGGIRRMLREVDGDILAFLPGMGEIRRVAEELGDPRGLDVLILHGDRPPEEQDRALRASSRRRIVLATDVAETSVTVEGIEGVVDSGWVRRPRFDPSTGLDRLDLVRISLASAIQRTGRAGRQGPGRCLRLWTKHDQRSFAAHETPEIRRVDPSGAILELLAWGESDPLAFPWLDAPKGDVVQRSLRLLEDLGARGSEGHLTPTGRHLARIPTHPRLGRMLLEGCRRGVGQRIALAAALLSDRDPTLQRRDDVPGTSTSDLLDRVEAIESDGRGTLEVHRRRAAACRRLASRLLDRAQSALQETPADRLAIDGQEDSDLSGGDQQFLRSVLAGFPDRVALRRLNDSERFVLVGGRGARLDSRSAVRGSPLVVAVEVDAGRGAEGRIRLASEVQPSWLSPQWLRTEESAFFDRDRERAVGRRATVYRDLTIEEVEVPATPRAASEALLGAAAEDLERALDLESPDVQGFVARLAFLAGLREDLDLPKIDEAYWTDLLPSLVTGRRSFAELRKVALRPILEGLLTPRQRTAIDREAPERVEVPTGSHLSLDYGDGTQPPILAVAIQELFGMKETPRIGGGRIPVQLHLLAPNRRPEQITRDLAHFWVEVYPQVRRELRGRYPRHPWPEDPLDAEPWKPGRPRKR